MSVFGFYGELIGCVTIPTHAPGTPDIMSLWLNSEGYHLTQRQPSRYRPMTLTGLKAIDWDASSVPDDTQSKIEAYLVMEEL